MADAAGALQLKMLGAQLRTIAGSGDISPVAGLGSGRTLRAQLLAGIRVATKPAVAATRQAARDTLPKRGGLNDYIAKEKIGVSTRLTGPRVGVRISATGGWGSNRGNVRHPVFGHTDRWVQQPINSAGWFDKTLEQERPAITAGVRAAMEAVAVEVTARL